MTEAAEELERSPAPGFADMTLDGPWRRKPPPRSFQNAKKSVSGGPSSKKPDS